MSRWQLYSFEDAAQWLRMPDAPGCYVVYCDGHLSYIGQASNVRKRIQSYKINYGYSNTIYTPWGGFSSITIKIRTPKRFGEWAMTELRLIKRLQPKLNCVGSTRKRNVKPERYSKAVGNY